METGTSFLKFQEKLRQNNFFSSEDPSPEYTSLGLHRERLSIMCIYKVPNQIRSVSEDAYCPRIVSIGPFHRGKPNLLALGQLKWRYMKCLFDRTPDPVKSMDECSKAILSLEARARGSYAENIKIDILELAEIMLVDGCFILEVFLRFLSQNFAHIPILDNFWIVQNLRRDLLLLENQIPFFILQHLFDITMPHISDKKPFDEHLPRSLIHVALHFFHPDFGVDKLEGILSQLQLGHSSHLLDLCLKFYCPKICTRRICTRNIDPKDKETRGFNYCATKLLEAGIDFKKHKDDFLFAISFRDGVITIPSLCISETTDSLLRNLIAFEQCSLDTNHFVTSYVILIKSLIHSSTDIKFLQQKGILTSNLDGVEDVLTLFNSILRGVIVKDFCFSELCEKVNAYQRLWWHWRRDRASWKVRWHGYMTVLKHDYFSSPWSIISFIAAVVLLSFTGLQAWYTLLSYYHHH